MYNSERSQLLMAQTMPSVPQLYCDSFIKLNEKHRPRYRPSEPVIQHLQLPLYIGENICDEPTHKPAFDSHLIERRADELFAEAPMQANTTKARGESMKQQVSSDMARDQYASELRATMLEKIAEKKRREAQEKQQAYEQRKKRTIEAAGSFLGRPSELATPDATKKAKPSDGESITSPVGEPRDEMAVEAKPPVDASTAAHGMTHPREYPFYDEAMKELLYVV